MTAKSSGASTIVNSLTNAESANMGPAMTDFRRNATSAATRNSVISTSLWALPTPSNKTSGLARKR